jgi:hypothetical protein
MMRRMFIVAAALAIGLGALARAADESRQGKLYVTWFGGVVSVVDVASAE